MFKRKLKPICRNCVLFDRSSKTCKVVILSEGERIHIPVDGNDACFFNNKFTAINDKGEQDSFEPIIDQVRWWVEDPHTGEQISGNGVVKIEYPESFFPKTDLQP
jgi:hypothetical protein